MDLRQAIHEDAIENHLVEEGHIMMSYVVVSAWSKIDDDRGKCLYVYQPEEGMKRHESVGLMEVGLNIMMEDSGNGGDDD